MLIIAAEATDRGGGSLAVSAWGAALGALRSGVFGVKNAVEDTSDRGPGRIKAPP